MTDRGPLSQSQARELRAACRANAERLVSDATLLLDGDGFPSAYNLAYFALEELVKARALLVLECMLIDGDLVDWSDFWRKWESHPAKSVSALAMGVDTSMVETRVLTLLTSPAAAQLGTKAKQLREKREKALYVDWTGAAVSTPASAVTAATARDLVDRVRSRGAVHDRLESLVAEDLPKARELLLHKIVLYARQGARPDEPAG